MIAKFVRYAPTVLLAVFCIVIFGTMSYTSLPRESSPDVKIPVVMISTPYIGVSPADIETLVTIPMENELSGVKDVKKLSSTSGEGISVISMEFEPDVVIEDALQRVRDRVNRVKVSLPGDAEEPAVQEISFSDFPILIVTLAGDVDQDVLKGYGEEMEDLIKRIPGVLDATLSGGRTRQIRVQFDPQRLSNYGFSQNDIISSIQQENVNIPGGDITAGDTSFLVRVPGEFDSVEQIENVAVKRKEGAPIFIRDLARVVDSYAEAETYARMNGQPAVSLAVTKRSGANIIDIADAVKVLAAEQSQGWEGVEYRLLADQSTQIRNMVSDLQNNILTALFLVIGVVLFFMGARNSLFVGIAIPLSMLMSFIIVQILGMTLNMIVLFSLILALGMLVDNAIVVVENIYRHMEEGKGLKEASVDGTKEVAIAVAASTATTVAAFLPMVFWEGIMGQFMGYLPKTVIIVLVSSLVVAVAILPVATSRMMKRTTGPSAPVAEAPSPLMQRYRGLLVLSIRHRYISAAIGVGTLIFSFMAYGALNHGTEFFPDTEPNRATISVRTPDGTDLETTDRIVRQIESILATQENVDVTIAETGIGGGGSPMGGAQANANQARMTVDFLPDRNSAKPGEQVRIENTRDTIDRLRETLIQIPGAEIKVEKENLGPPVGKPISVEVSGPDFHSVGELAAKIRREIREIEGTADIQDDYRVGRPELRLQIDRGAAKRVGSSTSGVANAVRTAISGTTASTLRDGKDEYDIVVEVDPRFSADAQAILNLRIPGREDTRPDTFSVPLSSVASYEMIGGSGGIRHIDQELVVTIEGDIAEGYNENAVRADVIASIERMKGEGIVPAGYDLRLGGANDEQRDAQEFLGRAFLIAISLIAVVLVTQFNSFTTPVVILASVVLSLVGVLWGLIITGTPFGIIMTGIGVISLAGVVVNNAIVLLDYVEQLMERGVDSEEALIQAGMTRFRPVMLTAITTILGLVPMALGLSFDFSNFKLLVGGQNAEFWGPMAIAVIFGLAFATLLTLVMVPTMYAIITDLKRWLPGGKSGKAQVTVMATLLALAMMPTMAQGGTVTLEDALRAADAENIDLAIAREGTVQAETLKGKALSLLSPTLSLGGSYTINQYETALDPSTFGDPQAQLDAQADLFEGIGNSFSSLSDPAAAAIGQGWFDNADELRGTTVDTGDPIIIQAKTATAGSLTLNQSLFNARTPVLWWGAQRTVDSAQQMEDWTRQQIRAGVAASYYQLALSRESLKLSRQGMLIAEQQVELATRQLASGSISRREMIAAQLALAEAQSAMLSAREQEVASAIAFSRQTGLPEDSNLITPEPLAVPADLAQAMAASSTRPDVLASENQARAAELSATANRLSWLPTASGTFRYAYTDNPGFIDENTTWMVIFQADWLLWDGGMRVASQREENSKARQAQLRVEQASNNAKDSIRNAWEKLERSQASLEAAEARVALASESLTLVERSEVAGGSTTLDLEQARLQLIQAEIGLLSERMVRDLSAIEVRASMGDYR